MNVKLIDEAVNDLTSLTARQRQQVKERLHELEDGPLTHPDSSLFTKHGLELFRFKLKDALLDHRAFFDLDGQTIIVLGIFHRDEAYTPDSLDELEDRM
jgi:mRNA-degrading endonuclease RelE of RelBE toxin-antitoxin system